MTVYQWLCLLGAPALIAAVFKYLHSLVKKNALDTAAVKAGLQALLRSQMISDYNKWEERGFAPIYARENFENCWKQYHSLGVNGVMDDLHNKFLELPVSPPDESQETRVFQNHNRHRRGRYGYRNGLYFGRCLENRRHLATCIPYPRHLRRARYRDRLLLQ